MSTDILPAPEECTSLAVRQAARHVTQFYDQYLGPAGLRTTQFYDQFLAPLGLRATQSSVLAKLGQLQPMTINALANELMMDRTTLGRNILPLEREGLLSIVPGRIDRRSKELQLTKAGIERLHAARKRWSEAQKRFATIFGEQRTAGLRALLHEVSATDLPAASG